MAESKKTTGGASKPSPRPATRTSISSSVELAIEALDRREWPRTKLEIQLLRSALFAAQALVRGMIADGRAEEIEQIRRSISEIVPDLPTTRPTNRRTEQALIASDRLSPETWDE